MKNLIPALCFAAICVGLYGYFASDLQRSAAVLRARRWLASELSPAPLPPATAPARRGASFPRAGFSPGVFPSVPALPSATPAPDLPPPSPALLDAIVTITGPEGAGTGFLCRFRGKTYVATNQHVLGVGPSLLIRAAGGAQILARQVFAAGDADIALIECAPLPAGTTTLEIAALPAPAIQQSDAVLVLGNSKGDGVITQTPGKLLAVGPQRVEVSNPIYPGNSGSPIIHVATREVVGVLTEVEVLTLDEFEKASFHSQDSAIKSTVRYFGHRIDSVQRWEGLDWAQFQATEAAIRQSREELDAISAYFLHPRESGYKNFKALHEARNSAAGVFTDRNVSATDRTAAYERLLRDIGNFARNARARLVNHKVYYYQQGKVATVNRMSDAVLEVTGIIQRDQTLAAALLDRGN